MQTPEAQYSNRRIIIRDPDGFSFRVIRPYTIGNNKGYACESYPTIGALRVGIMHLKGTDIEIIYRIGPNETSSEMPISWGEPLIDTIP